MSEDVPAVIRELFKLLPDQPPFRHRERVKWLRAMAAAIDVVYPLPDGTPRETIEVTGSRGAADTEAPQVSHLSTLPPPIQKETED